jgi:hypothetical protein
VCQNVLEKTVFLVSRPADFGAGFRSSIAALPSYNWSMALPSDFWATFNAERIAVRDLWLNVVRGGQVLRSYSYRAGHKPGMRGVT